MSIDEQIAALEQAIGSGVAKVVTQSQGVRTEVEYQSISQMQTAVDKLKARRAGASRLILAAL